jgi:MinD-like ATPase involved in chromosome partitioning or flagellar assembly
MGAKVICMASAKGGSGKTVLTATFAAFLVNLGKRVLMIDTDAATNGLTLMFLKETRMQADLAISKRRVAHGIYETILFHELDIVKTPTGADLIPATYEFINTGTVDVQQFNEALGNALSAFVKTYDFIFLDAQAGTDEVAHISMSQKYSDQVIIVSEYDPLSAAGVERLKGLFREDLTYVRTWVLLNKMLPEFVKSFSDFMEVAKYASPIPWDAEVVRAYSRRRLALDLEKGNEFTLAVVQTLRGIFGDEIEAEINEWLKSRTEALREPIETQYQDAERELEALFLERRSLQERLSEQEKLKNRKVIMLRSISTNILAGSLCVIAFIAVRPDLLELSHMTNNILMETFTAIIILLLFVIGNEYITKYIHLRLKRNNSSDPAFEIMEARLLRQLDSLQERLKKLEALRTADVSVLLKHRSSID